MTCYLAAYDTEMSGARRPRPDVPSCLEACRRIVEVHRRHGMPATFFIVGDVLEETPEEFRRLLDDELFEVASHGWSHRLLRDHPVCGPAASPDEIREEIERGVASVVRVFDRPCRGFRPGCGFSDGLRGAPELLGLLARSGVRYVSSVLWGEDCSLPAPVRQPFTYAEEGHPALREIPACGWHENLLKGSNRVFGQGARRAILFPAPFPEAVPHGYVATPEEEFRYNNRFFIDRALAEGSAHVTLVWHPWSLAFFDPAMRMLELTFRYVRERGLEPCTFGGFDERLRA
jgi:peptidoglycan/xylan/chitin deacetylase (PgdA/CDA1 family)